MGLRTLRYVERKNSRNVLEWNSIFFKRESDWFFLIPVDIGSYLKRDFSGLFGTTRRKLGYAFRHGV